MLNFNCASMYVLPRIHMLCTSIKGEHKLIISLTMLIQFLTKNSWTNTDSLEPLGPKLMILKDSAFNHIIIR